MKTTWTTIAVAVSLTVAPATLSAQTPLGTAFTYQGQLRESGVRFTGTADMDFALFDAASVGNQVGSPIILPAVAVTDGVFTVELDFGASAFNGDARWLEITVDDETLSPRQALNGTPYALQTRNLFVDEAGQVGIGTNTPASELDVAGTVTATAFVGDGSGLTGLVGSTVDLESIALLRWDPIIQSFPTDTPSAVAFDGANIWVTNAGNHTVTKLRASDGVEQPGSPFTVGSGPVGVAFDGANIWVANLNDNNVTKLRASDGLHLGTFPAGTNPRGVAFDGANIWVTNQTSNDVTKLRASDGVHLGTFPVGISPIAVAFDGANIWVTNSFDNNVIKLRASDGATLGTFPVGDGPLGVAFDGVNIWVANFNSDNVTKLRASDGVHLGTFPVGDGPFGVAFDGANIWVANFRSGDVTKLALDGANRGTFPVGVSPIGVAFDGANIWVANRDSNNATRISVVR